MISIGQAWEQAELQPVEHENAGAFRKFPVITDHGADAYRTLSGILLADRKLCSGAQTAFIAKIAGMNFGIVKRSPAMTVKQAQSVARQRIMLFRKVSPIAMFSSAARVLKTADEIAVGKQRIAFQRGYGFGDPIPIAPHFRKQRQIRWAA